MYVLYGKNGHNSTRKLWHRVVELLTLRKLTVRRQEFVECAIALLRTDIYYEISNNRAFLV